MIPKCLIRTYLFHVYLQTHFHDQTITHGRTYICVLLKMWRNSLASCLQLSRVQKQIPRLVMRAKRVRGAMVRWTTSNLMLAALSANLVESLLWSYQSTVTTTQSLLPSCFKRDYPDRVRQLCHPRNVATGGKMKDSRSSVISNNSSTGIV